MSARIAGMGAVCSVGGTVAETFDALCAGRSGLRPLVGFDPSRYRARSAYEVADRAPGTDLPYRATHLLETAIAEAVRQAGIGDDLAAVPVLVGTGLRELRSVELWWRGGLGVDATRLHFGTALRERFGATDVHTVANACSASLHTLALGADLIDADEADTVVVAGDDVLTESMFGLLDRFNQEPPDRVRPFDRNRRGVLMGDGATAVVLRRDRDSDDPAPLVRLRAVGLNCDATHVTAPDPRGIAAAITQAHRAAGLKAADVDLVLLHGTGTVLNDDAESAAMTAAFGEHVGSPVMTAIKSMTGHTSGASGLLGVVVAAESLRSGLVPPTPGLDDPAEPALSFRFARGAAQRPVAMSVAQVNAFGFGGVNAVAILERRP
jgi:3-oxoacyl-[acyl-carrier-protein] synthase II